MQHRVSSGMTPLPSLQVVVPTHREVTPVHRGSPPEQEVTASGSTSRPKIALKSPRTAAGKAQVASATQKCGSGGGSKGICLEDSSTSDAAKHQRLAKQSAKFHSGHHCFENTFEESDDSNESFDGPFLGPSSTVKASSTTRGSVWRTLPPLMQPNVGAPRSNLPNSTQATTASRIPLKSLTTPTNHSMVPSREPSSTVTASSTTTDIPPTAQ